MKREYAGTEVAIVGVSGHYPRSRSIADFWRQIREGGELVTFFSEEELRARGVAPELLQDPKYVRAAAFLEDTELFDAAFFGIAPKEAALLDPQHRHFLECAWEVLEDAGYDPERYPGRIGIYGGTAMDTYILYNLLRHPAVMATDTMQVQLANDKDYLTTRVSYKLNLRGPSHLVQSACSTSLVATHLACQSLLNEESDMAIAGGASVVVSLRHGYLYKDGGVYSPDGRCRSFDAAAGGTIFGSGVGCVALKLLDRALEDGDPIYGIILGTAVNNDGSHKVGFAAPSVSGLADVVTEALGNAGVSAESIDYVEAHGTATRIGDPIEIQGLTKAFRTHTDRRQYCAIGSVKTNVGHLDAASGVTGLIKVALSLRDGVIPPSLHFQKPNPAIDFAGSPFFVNDRLRPWERHGSPRRAGVSAMGIGGTNAHVVLEEAPPREPSPPAQPFQLLVMSARTETALEQVTVRLAEHLDAHPELNLADVAFTLQVGRRPFEHRCFAVVRDTSEVASALATAGHKGGGRVRAQKASVAFLFSGQGSQYAGMASGLYRREPVFREHFDACAAVFRTLRGTDLGALVFSRDAGEALRRTEITQPALFAVEYALARLLLHWGVKPDVLMGHSIGEYVAACLAGVFSPEDAMRLVCERGRLMGQLPEGAMLAVPLTEQALRPLLGDALSLAAVNAPGRCVVSGPVAAIAALEQRLDSEGVRGRRLVTSHAFHSAMMNPILDEFAAAVGRVRRQPPTVPFISNLTGQLITPAQATDPRYWAEHLRGTVRFSDGLTELASSPHRILLEVGPGNTLTTLALQHLRGERTGVAVATLPHPQESQEDVPVLLTALGKLWQEGVEIDWRALHGTAGRRRVSLPTYPFERERYWFDAVEAAALSANSLDAPGAMAAPARKSDPADWFYLPTWQRSFLSLAAPRSPAPVLVFSEESGLDAALVDELRRSHHPVTVVTRGTGFGQGEANCYTLDPLAPADYQILFAELDRQGHAPRRIVYLWGLCQDTCQNNSEVAAAALEHYLGLVHLAQAIGERAASQPLDLLVALHEVHAITGNETLRLESATLLGPVRVFPHEYPQVTCRAVDVVVPRDGEGLRQLAAQLALELDAGAGAGNQIVAYRQGHRWVQDVQPLRLYKGAGLPERLRPRGTYLITGGLGGLGLVFARYLAETVQARLILTGRSVPDPKDRSDPSDPRRAALAGILADLEARGAEVLALRADVADPQAMRAVWDTARERFGAVHGVIHAAGVPGGGILQRVRREQALAVQAAKVRGTLVLDELIADTRLDFFFLCSSVASLRGGLGQVDYATANAFMDAYAQARATRPGTHVVSIVWDAWKEVGMTVAAARRLFEARPPGAEPAAAVAVAAAGGESTDRPELELVDYGLTPAEGIEVLERVLCGAPPQVVAATRDFVAVLRRGPDSILEAVQNARAASRKSAIQHRRPHLEVAFVAPRDAVEEGIAEVWRELLGIESVGVDDNFFELGGDSMVAIQILGTLRKKFGVEVPTDGLFKQPTVAGLAQILRRTPGAAGAAPGSDQGTVAQGAQAQKTAPAGAEAGENGEVEDFVL
jgi:acyl transferase domain-containing protein/acyl carrier protein